MKEDGSMNMTDGVEFQLLLAAATESTGCTDHTL